MGPSGLEAPSAGDDSAGVLGTGEAASAGEVGVAPFSGAPKRSWLSSVGVDDAGEVSDDLMGDAVSDGAVELL